ncbi:MAG: sugar ABC transporter substrate-binding protein [Candidatus Eremiobacteraeota bacterium]|nr:sugar ABC transporter substrate-binding protein [Candidatus Eremiobacteraeota bacterium]
MKTHQNRSNLLLFILISVIFIMPACQKDTGNHVVYMQWGDPREVEITRTLLKEFENRNPDIKVDVIHATDYHTKLNTMLAGGTPPDVFYVSANDFLHYAKRDVLLNLEPYIERDRKELNMKDFYPKLLSVFTYNGALYGIPKDFTTAVLYYNKDMFDEAGVSYPDDSWDWDKLVSIARKLTKEKGMAGFKQYGIDPGFEYSLFIYQNDGRIMNEDRTRCIIDEPASVEAVRFFADLKNKYHVAPTAVEAADSPVGLEVRGSAMCIGGRWLVPRFRRITKFKWDVAHLPRGKKRSTLIYTVCYSISRKCKHPENAWKLVKFLTGPEGQAMQSRLGLAIPSRRSVAESDAFFDGKPPENTRVYLDAMDYARFLPYFPQWVEARHKMDNHLEQVWTGKKSPEKGCKEAADAVNQLLKETQAGQ